jgi:hypothetical protein
MLTRLATNSAALVRKMQARATRIRPAMEAAAREQARVLEAEARRVMQARIYSVPIPLKASSARTLPLASRIRSQISKGPHGKWRRTGNLRRAEKGAVTGTTVVLKNTMRYARARSTLGTPGGRKIVSPGVQSVQWQAEAVKNKRAVIAEIRARRLRRALGG